MAAPSAYGVGAPALAHASWSVGSGIEQMICRIWNTASNTGVSSSRPTPLFSLASASAWTFSTNSTSLSSLSLASDSGPVTRSLVSLIDGPVTKNARYWVISDEMAVTAKTKTGAATVVFFTDFQCPYCRKTHAALTPLVEARRAKVRVVLRHVPLRQHPDARSAARAAICVERIANAVSEDFDRALFEAPDLSEAACEAMAVERGVEGDQLGVVHRGVWPRSAAGCSGTEVVSGT